MVEEDEKDEENALVKHRLRTTEQFSRESAHAEEEDDE